MASKSDIKETIPIKSLKGNASLQGDEQIIAEEASANDLVNVTRRKVVILVIVAIVLVLVIVGVLVGTFVPNYVNDDDSGNTECKGVGEDCSLRSLDVDECSTNLHTCDDNADCQNTVGSYTCSCKAGYTGDGQTCNDIDECSTNSHNCDVNAVCNNTPASYTCACKAGYSGDGRTCTEIDECSNNTHSCDVNAVCNNTLGSYTCACKAGYSGDGKTCTPSGSSVECDCWRSRSRIPGTLGVHWDYSNDPSGSRQVDAIDFQTNGDVILQGYRLWGVNSSSTSFQVTIRLYRASTLIAEKTGSYAISSSVTETFEVHFSQMISISAGITYTATARIVTSGWSLRLSDGMASASCSGITVTFKKSLKSSNGSSVSQGQIPALIFRSAQC